MFYGHTRLGTEEREFKAWKFRTMVVDADKVLEQYLMNDPEMRREWFEDQKLKKDPRVISGHRQPASKVQLGRDSAALERPGRRYEFGGAAAYRSFRKYISTKK